MEPRGRWGALALAAGMMALLGTVRAYGGGVPIEGTEDRIWLFNFSPEAGPNPEGFTRVTGKSVYDKQAGYGWVDLKGELKTGAWLNNTWHWEGCENLNLVMRPGPDDVGCTYATGPATFGLDLKPGMYEVWVLSGDWGLLEYVPHEPYRIKVEGQVAYSYDPSAGDFFKKYEDAGGDEVTTEAAAYQKSVKPRFEWKKITVGVYDGQLSVTVEGKKRDQLLLNTVGNYALTETAFGPEPRYPGAINAMMVTPATSHPVFGVNRIEMIETWRRENFRKKFPRAAGREPAGEAEPTAADKARGYTMFYPELTQGVRPETVKADEEKVVKLRTPAGERADFTFAVCPLRDLGRTTLITGYLRGPGGAVIAPTAIRPGVVRYVVGEVDKKTRSWRPVPEMIVPTASWDVVKGVAKQWWVGIEAPEKAKAGKYEGTLTLAPATAGARTIKVELEVLPFKLERPTELAVGVTYFTPAQETFFGGEDRFWKRVKAEFADMRSHHMTTVQLTGMGLDNFDGLTKLLEAYRQAGFEQPVDLLESYSAYYLGERRRGLTKGTEPYFADFVAMFQKLVDESKKRNWPPIIYDYGDEFTNSEMEELGAELGKRLKTGIPGIVTGTDSNGSKEVALMAPNVSIVGFNVGWDGPKGVNRGKELLRTATVELVKKAGATPWLVNIGKDRFSNGYYLWKMSRLGVRGKIEWIYRSYDAYPHDFFDASGPRTMLAYPGPDYSVIPSVRWEQMRVGLDDLAYMVTLEKAVEAARKEGGKAATVAEAEAFLKKVDGMVPDDCWKYAGKKGPDEDVVSRWAPGQDDEVRDQAIDLILKLQGK